MPAYLGYFVSDSREFVRLMGEFQLHFCLAFLRQCNFFIFPRLVYLDTLVKYLLCESTSHPTCTLNLTRGLRLWNKNNNYQEINTNSIENAHQIQLKKSPTNALAKCISFHMPPSKGPQFCHPWEYCPKSKPNVDLHSAYTCMHARTHACTHARMHADTQPFYGSLDFIRHNPGELVHFTIFWIFWSKMKITQADAPTIRFNWRKVQQMRYTHNRFTAGLEYVRVHPGHPWEYCPKISKDLSGYWDASCQISCRSVKSRRRKP